MSASGSKLAWLGEGLRLQRASWICSSAPSNFSHLETTTAHTETSPHLLLPADRFTVAILAPWTPPGRCAYLLLSCEFKSFLIKK